MSTVQPPAPAGYALAKRFVRVLRPALGAARRGALAALRAARPAPAPVPPGARPTVHLFTFSAYNSGGIIKSVASAVGAFASRYDVEVVSVTRERDVPFHPLPDGVRVTVLDDLREPSRLRRLPSLLWHDADNSYKEVSLRTDLLLVRKLRSLSGGVVMATRPGLINVVAELAPRDARTVGQAHQPLATVHPALASAMRRHYRRLDAVSVLTRDQEQDYLAFLTGARTRVVRIPNAVPGSRAGVSRQRARVVVAAARLHPEKGHDVLLAAFERVVARRPDWVLRIYGEGFLEPAIRADVERRGLSQHVELRGLSDRLDEELVEASVLVLSSTTEAFGMVLVEAMSHGLAVVSTACAGPRDIITSGVDGLLVPVGDVEALAGALLRVIEDESERRRLAEAGIDRVTAYSPERVGAQWLALLDDLTGSARPDRDERATAVS